MTKNNYVAYNGLGGALDAAGKAEEALACYQKSVEIDPRYPEGQDNLGTALLNRGDLDGAISHLKAALKENPDYEVARNNLGKADMLEGKLDDAAAEFTKAVASQPTMRRRTTTWARSTCTKDGCRTRSASSTGQLRPSRIISTPMGTWAWRTWN